MARTTIKDLERQVARINELTGSPATSYTKFKDGTIKSNPLNYHLDQAYGGIKLSRMCSEGGGIYDISSGYGTKAELERFMNALIMGLQMVTCLRDAA